MKKFELTLNEAEYILSTACPGEDWVDRAEKWAEFGCVWDGDAESLYAEAWRMIHPHYIFGVCAGRHEMPVDKYVFDEIVDPTDNIGLYNRAWRRIPEDAESIDLYVTGFTPATLAIVAVCADRHISLTAWHYDKEKAKYKPQIVLR